ncbi:MAG: hypothetical protein V4463_10305 [Pseudomonadota bacterium]
MLNWPKQQANDPAYNRRMVRLLSTLIALAAMHDAGAACTLRIGYVDQERSPYYLGSGRRMADPPGASVELLRDIAAAGNCQANFFRFPQMRLRLGVCAAEN